MINFEMFIERCYRKGFSRYILCYEIVVCVSKESRVLGHLRELERLKVVQTIYKKVSKVMHIDYLKREVEYSNT